MPHKGPSFLVILWWLLLQVRWMYQLLIYLWIYAGLEGAPPWSYEEEGGISLHVLCGSLATLRTKMLMDCGAWHLHGTFLRDLLQVFSPLCLHSSSAF